jgi:hypothetical protein
MPRSAARTKTPTFADYAADQLAGDPETTPPEPGPVPEQPPQEPPPAEEEDDETTLPPEENPEDEPAAHLANIKYENRIRIIESFKYPGHLKNAPEWIDKSWIAFADRDDSRHLEAGPALKVPSPAGGEHFQIARIGDYVCREEIRFAEALPPETRVEVWQAAEFQRLFMPVNW